MRGLWPAVRDQLSWLGGLAGNGFVHVKLIEFREDRCCWEKREFSSSERSRKPSELSFVAWKISQPVRIPFPVDLTGLGPCCASADMYDVCSMGSFLVPSRVGGS